MKVGDIVQIKQSRPEDWPEAQDHTGVIIGFGKRLYIPAARVFILGEVCDFDLDELELISETR